MEPNLSPSPDNAEPGKPKSDSNVAMRTQRWIMGALAVWGLLLGIGVYIQTGSLLGLWIVLGCTGVFLVVWILLLMLLESRRPGEKKDRARHE